MTPIIDICTGKPAEQELSEREEILRLGPCKNIESRKNQHKPVAKELHDGVGSNMEAIKLALSIKLGLEQKLESMGNAPKDDYSPQENFISNMQDALTDARRMFNHMMPSALEELGLLETIRWFCEENGKYYRNFRIISRLEVEESNLSEQLDISVFHVLQESVSNAFKHGRADTIHVGLTNVGDCIELLVTDNGRGFDLKNIRSIPGSWYGLGVKGMMDRAEICNGTFDISSEIGKGTQVKLTLPYGEMK